MRAECALDAPSLYKPSFVMEWRVSPIQDKTLCKGTVGAGGMAAFPGGTRANTNMMFPDNAAYNNNQWYGMGKK